MGSPPEDGGAGSFGSPRGDGHVNFPVVGVGASAGGLEAFREFIERLPTSTGMVFLLVQHLDPHHASNLSALLARVTQLPVLEASNGLEVAPNRIYVIPPNTNLSLSGRALSLAPRGEGPHLPVDCLFRSLAHELDCRAIGVILSGTGTDGTLGLAEIKAAGGITFAQSEDSARHAGMPHSAIQAGCVDFALPPAEIAERLAAISRHSYLADGPGGVREGEGRGQPPFLAILNCIRDRFRVDLSQYRESTLRRRIQRRMALRGRAAMADYAGLLHGEAAELDALYRDLLINVTSFFRDPAAFTLLRQRVFPGLAAAHTPGSPLRAWVAGCSSGEEAYSIAMELCEYFDERPGRPAIQIFATDLVDPQRARVGAYSESIEAEVSPARLRRFFHKDDNAYRINKEVRDMCVFARHDLTVDPPFSRLDLIACRNVMIYMGSELHKRVLLNFHYALNQPGYLALGSAESIGEYAEYFEQLDASQKVFQRKPAAMRAMPVPRFPSPETARAGASQAGPARAVSSPGAFLREADRVLLGRFAPPGVLINENFDILQFRGRTREYLESPPGQPTAGLLKMAREGLLLDLRTAVDEAKERGKTVLRSSQVQGPGGLRPVTLEVIPITVPDAGCLLVLFSEGHRAESGEPAPEPAAAGDIGSLRRELAATKDYLESLLEERDRSTEELRCAYEEILSSNEELQSTNEELETAKEELQSSNEELTTVNEQLQLRNNETTRLTNDLSNLLANTSIPIVMVGEDLKIRRLTPAARQLLGLSEKDVGRSLGDFKLPLGAPDLEETIHRVVSRLESCRREILYRDRWYLLNVNPYRTPERGIEGAVVVLLDIDQHKRTEGLLRAADRQKDEFIASLAHELRNPLGTISNGLEVMRQSGNRGDAEAMRELIGRQVGQLIHLIDDLLDISRISRGKVELRRQRVTLREVVDRAIEASAWVLKKKDQRLELKVPAEPVWMNADAARLVQLLSNLLNNASKFSDGGGTIRLAAEREANGGDVLLHVRDSGRGIAPPLLPHVFEMFVQGDSTQGRTSEGLGIGLSLAASIVELHGGRIEAHSDGIGHGSEFLIRLPVLEVAPEAAPKKPDHASSTGAGRAAMPRDPLAPDRPEGPRAPARSGPTTTRRRILLVDDNPDSVRSLQILLKTWGHEVHVAHDGAGALATAAEVSPEIILLDIGLPDISGYEVARQLRAMPRFGPVTMIAQTGFGQESDRLRARESGFDHHLAKPVDIQQLKALLA